MDVRDKYTGDVIGRVPDATREDVARANARAREAFLSWSQTPAHRRAGILRRTADLIAARQEELATLIAREAGKAWKHAAGEVQRGVETFTFAGEEAKRIHGETVPMDASPAGENRLGFYLRTPVGVVAAITPFNFPLNLVAHKVAPALAAGNTVVLKPAEETPLTAVRLAEILAEAGLPEGVLQAGARRRADRGRGAGAPIPPPPRSLHRQPAGGRADPVHGRPQARDAGAGQQLRHDRRAGRGPGPRHPAVRGVGLRQRRPGVHQPAAAVRPPGRGRGGSCGASWRHRALKVGNPLDAKDRRGADDLGRGGGPRRGGSAKRSRRARGCSMGGRREGRLVWPTVLTDTRPEMKVMCQEAFAPVVSLVPYDDFDGRPAAARRLALRPAGGDLHAGPAQGVRGRDAARHGRRSWSTTRRSSGSTTCRMAATA